MDAEPGAHRRRGERASALVMVPALVLVVLALGAIAADGALAHSAQRSAYATVSAAADDAAAMVDDRAHQIDGSVRIDRAAAVAVARAHLGLGGAVPASEVAGDHSAFRVVRAEVSATDTTVTVAATVEVPHLFLGALPGVDEVGEVPVTVTGRLR